MALPLKFNTKIGRDGVGLSQGQKQRILIARAVYKNPDYIFLDEATNSLDANNERSIVENLDKFYKGKTVVIVAHRLSTVKNADQIVVIDHGKVVEVGNHESLTAKRGAYYNLVKNQLELGNPQIRNLIGCSGTMPEKLQGSFSSTRSLYKRNVRRHKPPLPHKAA